MLMAEAIASLAVKRISELLVNEAVFLKDVKEQVQSLNTELKRMQCFLKDVDRKPEQDNRLRNRVSEIRDLAYDAEDVLESFILKVAHEGGFKGTVKKFTSVFTKPFHLHEIKVQVEAIQTKLESISKSLPAYEISGEGVGSSSTSTVKQQLRRTYSHVEEEDVVSLEVSTKDVVAQLMTKEDRLHAVVSIVGMGGLGKTTLARKVYNDVEVRRHFDCRAWVFISQQCNPREVLREVLKKVLCPSKEERELIEKLEENELTKKLFDVLKEKLYLVVLDDIWRSEDWDILKPAFPRGKQGSKILMTTRYRSIALHADPWHSPMELPLLTDDESWYLLSRKVFSQNKTDSHVCSIEFENLGRVMVKKCGGLPLAIVVLGGMLATKHSLAQWETVHRNIHGQGLQQQDRQYDAVNGVLALSYNDLPHHLKSCFLYIGHYPEDWEISKHELIRLWIAEGFISPTPECTEMVMEDVGEQFLEELINRSMVQIGSRDYTGKKIKTCRIHDLLRDLCIEKAREENFLEIIHPSGSVDITLAESMLRRIAIHPSQRYISLKGEHKKLRSLFLFPNEDLLKLHISKCKSFKSLRVLTLVKRDYGEKWHVSSEIGNLQHLRYLKLQAVEIILPQSIGRLKNLDTLYVSYFHKIVIPNVLFKFERIRHFVLRNLFNYLNRPVIFLASRLTSKSIVTLKHIMVDKKFIENSTVSRLTDIQSLGLTFRRSEYVMPILTSLIELNRLGSLCMQFESKFTSMYQELGPLFECHRLSKLKLIGEIREYPHPRPHALSYLPPNIVKLTLNFSHIKQDPMGVLEKLPCLRILMLRSCAYGGSKMICSANGFPQLDSLLMDGLYHLEEWEIEEGTMPRLRSLHLRSTRRLERFPEGLKYITTLQEMKLEDMRLSLVERIKVRDGREGEDLYKVRHIPSINLSRLV